MNKYNLSFHINFSDIDAFIKHWSSRYAYPDEELYNKNIGKELTETSILELFEWKNGSKISNKKIKSIKENYPIKFNGILEERYLNHRNGGGAIWNIFYIHCLKPKIWPIYDQHTHRAMRYLISGVIEEIGITDKQKYNSYKNEYIPFVKSFDGYDERKVDKALFTFGQFLKIMKKYA